MAARACSPRSMGRSPDENLCQFPTLVTILLESSSAPKKLMTALADFISQTTSNASSISQAAALEALAHGEKDLQEARANLIKKMQWCREQFKAHSFMQFIEVEMHNERYRPHGSTVRAPLPLPNSAFDIACLFSVFTHLLPNDIEFYLGELARVLEGEGRVIFTLYQDNASPDFSVNPKNAFGPYEASPLHRVRYNRHFLAEKIRRHGFTVLRSDRQWLQNQDLVVMKRSAH